MQFRGAELEGFLAAATDAAPLAQLPSQIEVAAAERRLSRMAREVMGQVTRVGVVPNGPPAQHEQIAQKLEAPAERHSAVTVCECTGTSDDGSTGRPFSTRQLTRNVSAITIQRIAVNITASAASSR
jgi:hypothetical protein